MHNRTVQIGHIKRELSPTYDKHPDNEGVGVEGLLLLSVLKKQNKTKNKKTKTKKRGGGRGLSVRKHEFQYSPTVCAGFALTEFGPLIENLDSRKQLRVVKRQNRLVNRKKEFERSATGKRGERQLCS